MAFKFKTRVVEDRGVQLNFEQLESLLAIGPSPRVLLLKTGSQALPNTAVTNVTWDSSTDVVGTPIWSAGTPGAITFPEDGVYAISVGLFFANAAGDHDLFLTQYNNTGLRFAELNGSVGAAAYRALTLVRSFTAGFQVGLYAFQNSGGASTVGSASEQAAHLQVTKLR